MCWRGGSWAVCYQVRARWVSCAVFECDVAVVAVAAGVRMGKNPDGGRCATAVIVIVIIIVINVAVSSSLHAVLRCVCMCVLRVFERGARRANIGT